MRRYLTIALIVVGLGALFLWWRGRPASGPGASDVAPVVPDSNSPTVTSEQSPQINAGHAELVAPPGEDPEQRSARPEVVRAQNEAQNVPVYFYGLVVDQDTNPVQNVTVDIEVSQWLVDQTTAVTEKTTRLQKQTGPDGRFEVSGMTASVVTVKGFTKEGYEPEMRKPRYGDYGAQSTGFDHPAVFNLWSTNFHEQLITGNKSFEIVPDGRPYLINLMEGTISQSGTGDLKVWIQYTNQVVRGQICDWSAEIQVTDGGLLEVTQAVMNSGFFPDPPFAMYSAPGGGYVPSFRLAAQIRGGQEGEIGNRYFYLRLNGGKEYGRMSINLFAPYGRLHPGLVSIAYAINPSGSRSLW
jgi:hypothetical protein